MQAASRNTLSKEKLEEKRPITHDTWTDDLSDGVSYAYANLVDITIGG
jgi:hypothetical protein